MIDTAVEQFISQLTKNPKFKSALDKKISSETDASELEKEIEILEKKRKQLVGAKSHLWQRMSDLDIDDNFYTQKYADMEEQLNKFYAEIESVDSNIEMLRQRISMPSRNSCPQRVCTVS